MQLQLYGRKIWLYRQPIDFRCSIDGLSSIVAHQLKQNPQEGIYLFYNRGKDKIKCLCVANCLKIKKLQFIFKFHYLILR